MVPLLSFRTEWLSAEKRGGRHTAGEFSGAERRKEFLAGPSSKPCEGEERKRGRTSCPYRRKKEEEKNTARESCAEPAIKKKKKKGTTYSRKRILAKPPKTKLFLYLDPR